MPDRSDELMLEQLLEYREPAGSDKFVIAVMQDVKREQRARKLILYVFGLIGAVFGVLGAVMLSDGIARIFSGLPATGTMQAVLIGVAVVAFYGWFMNEDVDLTS